MALGFLKDFRKNVEKLSKSISLGLRPPRGWWSTGNYALNKAFSGSFTKGIPISRIAALVGPSGCFSKDEKISVYVMHTAPLPDILVKHENEKDNV